MAACRRNGQASTESSLCVSTEKPLQYRLQNVVSKGCGSTLSETQTERHREKEREREDDALPGTLRRFFLWLDWFVDMEVYDILER